MVKKQSRKLENKLTLLLTTYFEFDIAVETIVFR